MIFERQISKSKTMIFERQILKLKTVIFVYLRQRHTQSRKETALLQIIISGKLSLECSKIFVFKLCCCIVHVVLMLPTCEDRKTPSSIFVKKWHRSFIMTMQTPVKFLLQKLVNLRLFIFYLALPDCHIIANLFGLGKSTVCTTIHSTCEPIFKKVMR